jgi:hypothetical protein
VTDAVIDASFGTQIVRWGWFYTRRRSPVKGLIVKRFESGALWVGFCDGSPKHADCEAWYPILGEVVK